MTEPSASANIRIVSSSQPQLVHSESQQSIAASEEYYSFSDTSNPSKVTVLRYETPPSRNRSPLSNAVDDNMEAPETGRSAQLVNGVSTSPSLKASGNETPVAGPSRQNNIQQGNTRAQDTETPTPGIDDIPYIRFAIDQLTRDEEVSGEGRQDSILDLDYPVERIIADEGLGYFSSSFRAVDQPREERRRTPEPRTSTDELAPITRPEDRYRYPKLDFVPYSLRPLALASIIFLCLLMMAGLIFCNIWSRRHDGLWAYDGLGGPRYFAFQFLPQLLGILIVMWLFVVQSAVYRILPLALLASGQPSGRALQKLPMLPRNFLFPDFSYFGSSEPIVGACLFIIWLVNLFAVPLHSCLFQARYYSTLEDGGFQWTAVQGVGWTLLALYALLVCALVGLMARFVGRATGLMWDPVCLADIIPLIQKSNCLGRFNQLETSPAVDLDLSANDLRLGYWTTKSREVVYGIGMERTPISEGTTERNTPMERKSEHSQPSATIDLEKQPLSSKDSFERDLLSPYVRYRWCPWFLRDSFVVAWIVVAFILLVAFIVVTFVNDAIADGFLPLLSTLPSTLGFSPSNFLYSFIPSLLGMVLFLVWQPTDVYFRSIEPFSNLSSFEGASADKSILLNYPSRLPIEVTLSALAAGHYKVAYISAISFLSAAIPVLAGGIFIACFYPADNEIRMTSYMSAYYVLIAVLIIYALSYLILWPRRKRYLPHPIYTYADVISFLYQSPILEDKVFREPKTKIDLVTRAIVAPPCEGEYALYGFGLYRGRDQRDHLGIDRVRRPGSHDVAVGLS